MSHDFVHTVQSREVNFQNNTSVFGCIYPSPSKLMSLQQKQNRNSVNKAFKSSLQSKSLLGG